MDYSGYNYQQQHSYGYDPSQIQIQPYDQSYAAAAYQQQYYAYDSQYAFFPNSNEPQFHFQPEHAPIHPPGVNPNPPQPASIGPSQYRGRGGRGGRPFRGAGRGRGHGRGHGVGSSRHIPSHSSGPAISNAPGAPVAAGATSVVVPSSSHSAKKPPVPPRKACCEICKVECNSPEILEQHKNGKKHQKNMRMHEELQRRSAIIGQQSGHLTEQPKKVEESEKNGCPTENIGSGVIIDNQKEEMDLQNDNAGNISEIPAEVPDGKTMDNTAGRGLKRKKKGGKGGKYMRTNDGSKPVEPAQTLSFRCELCDVKCESQAVYQSHVTGRKHLSKLRRAQDPQALSGAGQQQVLSGALSGLQAFYPPDINALSNAINAQVQQGDNDPQVLLAQLLMTVISQAQAQAQVQAQTPVTGTMAAQIPPPTSVAGPSNESQLLQTQVSEITAQVTMENPSGETKTEQLPVPVAPNVQPGSSVSTQIEGGGSETKEQV